MGQLSRRTRRADWLNVKASKEERAREGELEHNAKRRQSKIESALPDKTMIVQ